MSSGTGDFFKVVLGYQLMFPNARFGKEISSLPYVDWQQRKEVLLGIGKTIHDDAMQTIARHSDVQVDREGVNESGNDSKDS